MEDLRHKAIVSLALPDLRLEKELPGWTSDMISCAIDDTFEPLCPARQARCDQRPPGRGRTGNLPTVRDRTRKGPLGARLQPRRPLPGRRQSGTADQGLGPGPQGAGRRRSRPASAAQYLHFSPDSRRMVVVFADGAFGIYDLATGRLERRWQGSLPGCRWVVFHPDGHQFAAFFGGNGIQFWSADSGRLVGSIPTVADVQYRLLEPGRSSAGVHERRCNSRIHLWDVAERTEVGVLEGHKNCAVAAVFNPAGDLVASNGWEGMLRLWDPRTGRQLLSMPDRGVSQIQPRGRSHLAAAQGSANLGSRRRPRVPHLHRRSGSREEAPLRQLDQSGWSLPGGGV